MVGGAERFDDGGESGFVANDEDGVIVEDREVFDDGLGIVLGEKVQDLGFDVECLAKDVGGLFGAYEWAGKYELRGWGDLGKSVGGALGSLDAFGGEAS